MIGVTLLLAAQSAPIAAPTQTDLFALQAFSRCVVNRMPRAAAAAIDHDFRNQPEQFEQLEALVQSQRGCVGTAGKLRIRGGVILAGFFAEALLERRGLPALTPSDAMISARSESETIGLCVALAKPAETQALLRTTPGRNEEAEALRPLIGQLGACTKDGVQARFNKPGLRAVLALAYRRLTMRNSNDA